MSDIDISHIRRLDGNLLLVFRELARTRRTTTAARRLRLTQSTVSHALARLRAMFEDPLFVRRPHGLEPTRRALELAPRIDALIDMAGAVMGREDRFDPARSQRRFRFAAAEYVIALIGARLVETFRREAPRASFEVEFLRGAATLDVLRRGSIDLALGQFLRLPPGFDSEVLYEDGYCVAARKRHPALRKGTIDRATYARLPNVFVGHSGETGITDATIPDPGLVSTVALVPRWLTALTMVSTTDAIATCPRRLAERQARVLGLRVIDADFAGPRFSVLAVRRAGHADPGVDWLLKSIRAAVA